ncbi:MAG: hypothetical protein AAF708_18030 [Deinococcota bacterium]
MKPELPEGFTEEQIKDILEHYETQTEDEAVNEDEAALALEETLMQVPLELVADVRALIAKRQAKH